MNSKLSIIRRGLPRRAGLFYFQRNLPAAVHGFCTRSTKPMYSEYNVHVLAVQNPCTTAEGNTCCNLHTLQPQSEHPPAAIYTPSSRNLHTFQLQSTHPPAASYTPSSRNLHTFQPQTAQTTFANSTPSCRGCDNFSDMVIVSVKRS